MKNIVIVEFFVIFLVGVVPGLLAFHVGGAPEFESTMKGLVPNSIVMNYTAVIGLAFFVVAFLDWWFLKTSEISNKLFWYAHAVLSQVGTGVLSILRIGAGIFICLLGLWAYHEPNTIQAGNVLFLGGYALIMVIECVLIAYAHKHVQQWQRARL
jgi:hypothetical protein